MSVYSRFKRQPNGFRALVELLESTPTSRRAKMIEVGMAEDRDYTEQALRFMLTFEDVLGLPDLELAEILASAPARIVAMAIHPLDPGTQERFLRNARPAVRADIKTYLEGSQQITLRDTGGAQLKLVEITRGCEKKGYINTKRIPA